MPNADKEPPRGLLLCLDGGINKCSGIDHVAHPLWGQRRGRAVKSPLFAPGRAGWPRCSAAGPGWQAGEAPGGGGSGFQTGGKRNAGGARVPPAENGARVEGALRDARLAPAAGAEARLRRKRWP